MIELSENKVGIKFELNNLDIKNYFFNVSNDLSSIIIQYNDTVDQFNFFIDKLYYNSPEFINIEYNENILKIKESIFNKKFDLSLDHKIDMFNKFDDDPFKKLNLMNYNHLKNLNVSNIYKNLTINTNLYKMLNGKIETSLNLDGKFNLINYNLNLDSLDNMIISVDYDNLCGLGIKKTESFNSLNFFNNLELSDNNIKFNYTFLDKSSEINHQASVIYENNFFNFCLGSSIQTKSLDEILELGLGAKLFNFKEFDNLELNYKNDVKNSDYELEGLIKFSLGDLSISSYFDYFNNDFNLLSNISRYLKKIDN